MTLDPLYESGDVLARLPLGIIIRANPPDSAHPVIAKIFAPPSSLPAEFCETMLNTMAKEASALRETGNNQIVQPLEIIREPGLLIVHFPCANLPALSRFVKNKKPLSPQTVWTFIKQLKKIHDDLAAMNIQRFQFDPDFLTVSEDDLRLFYLDIAMVNLAKHIDAISFGYLDGLPQLLPPEVVCGNSPCAASPVYLFSIMAHYLLSGEMFLDSHSFVARGALGISEPLPPVRRFEPARAEMVNDVLERGSAKNPSCRIPALPQFMIELAEALGIEA